jgi:uncharacterized protein YutE (UPF0331/DUF86 family)
MTLEQLQPKLDLLKANLGNLSRIPQASYDDFVSDFRNVASALYLLQTSIQTLIDIGSYLVASRALRTPRTSHEVFEVLEEAGCLPEGSARRCVPIVGFRNRVVHLYDRVDERRVYEVLTQHTRDLAEIMDLLLQSLSDDV